MTPDFHLCDICKAKIPTDASIFVTKDRQWDASGNSYGAIGEHVELCASCWPKLIARLLLRENDRAASDYEVGERLLRELAAFKESGR